MRNMPKDKMYYAKMFSFKLGIPCINVVLTRVVNPSVFSSSGQIYLSERVTLKISCFMNLKNFPFDSQVKKNILHSTGVDTLK